MGLEVDRVSHITIYVMLYSAMIVNQHQWKLLEQPLNSMAVDVNV